MLVNETKAITFAAKSAASLTSWQMYFSHGYLSDSLEIQVDVRF